MDDAKDREIEYLRAVASVAYQLAGFVDADDRFLDLFSDATNGDMNMDDPLDVLPIVIEDIGPNCAK